MKSIRYVPLEATSVLIAVRETGEHVTVTGDGFETDCTHTQRVLDAHRSVTRQAKQRKPKETGQ